MMDEQLSAFLDEESDTATVEYAIRMLREDTEYRQAWQRQLWLRETLRAEDTIPSVDTGFADRVTAVLDAEETGHSKVVSLSRRHRRWWQGGAGLAAAASVAAMAVLAFQPFSAMAPTGGQPQVTAPTRVASVSVSADASAGSETNVTTGNWTVSDPVLESRLNGYLVEHASLASSYGMSGSRAGLVRVAAYGGNWR